MISGGQIAQGAITDNKVGKNANIKHSKLDTANEGEVLVAQRDGKLKAVRISGDARMSTTGKLTVSLPEVSLDEDVVKKSDLKEGKTLVGGPTKPEEVLVGSGANAIPQRDSSGNLKAETADQATNATSATNADNADKLDAQDGSHYLDVENHTGSSATSGDVITSYKPHKIFEVAATSSNTSNTPTTFTHSFGYIPDVTVYQDDGCGNYNEIDVDVTNTTSSSSINVSEGGVNLKVVIK